MEIEGKIIAKLPLQQGTSKAGNPWKKQEYVLETFGAYPRKVKFDFFGDRADSNQLEIGKTYKVQYDIESREFNGRWYTDIRAYASNESGASDFSTGGGAASDFTQVPPTNNINTDFGGDASDDLPF